MELNPPNTQSLPAATRLEEFVIERVLGSGGFGITYLARDTRLDRHVVIKENLPVQFCFRDTHSLTVAPRHTHGEDAENFKWSLENFSKEAARLASLDHPGIVKVLRSFDAFGTAYFVMPHLDGITLDELITSRRDKGQAFSDDELRGLLERVLGALSYLHDRGIYHRDLKPGNILITSDGVPVLIDFGSARQRLSERSMTVVESPGYTPFEQLQSRGNVGPWSDLYALGGTLVKVMTGETPPKAMDRMRKDPYQPLSGLADLHSRHNSEFLHLIDTALAVDENDRWQDAAGWLGALSAPVPRAPVWPQFQAEPVNRPEAVVPPARNASAAPEYQAGEEWEFDLVEGCKIRMCWIPPGEFLMGSPAGELGRYDDEVQHRVRITKGFWLGKYQATQGQWQAVMGKNPSNFEGGNLPVEKVSWDAIAGPGGFIGRVNQEAAGGGRFSLPTEAQWEYAARAGTSTALNSGRTLTSTSGECRHLDQVAWYRTNSESRTHPVGQKKPNAWGLHDMHGNVWEWCEDRYGPYPSGVGIDPQRSGSGTRRVLRGGGWGGNAGGCRVAYRFNFLPGSAYDHFGFRIARSAVP